MRKYDGGPAFPVEKLKFYDMPGMSLRDWLAGQASEEDIRDMQACKEPGVISRQTARYMHADAMLVQRDAPHEVVEKKQWIKAQRGNDASV